jgi:CHAT domain-containing protein
VEDGWIFPPLPGAEAEARYAHKLYGGHFFVGERATAENFMDHAGESDLIVFAAHAAADSEEPLDGSFLALTGSRLTPRDIQVLKLERGPTVVLSACQTGLGQSMNGGVVGLARAFQIAGAANTVMSLWDIDDEATGFLMQTFYKELNVWGSAESVRRAMLETRRRYPSPEKWAGFSNFGRPIIAWASLKPAIGMGYVENPPVDAN